MARHKPPQWVAIKELRAGTGYGKGADQRFDVAAFNVWPSKKFVRVVYEVKRSRNDWLRELKNPSKRASAEAWFHETWFVCDKGVAKEAEVPEGWGLLEPAGEKLRTRVHARMRVPGDAPATLYLSAMRRLAEPDVRLLEEREREARTHRRAMAIVEAQQLQLKRDRDVYLDKLDSINTLERMAAPFEGDVSTMVRAAVGKQVRRRIEDLKRHAQNIVSLIDFLEEMGNDT